MGASNSLLGDAFKILQDATTTGRVGARLPEKNASPERRRRRSRSRSARGDGRDRRRTDDSARGRAERNYRSPTPDGKARGQARAARKAKLIASMMGLDFP